jgi:hypothetical protein
VLLRTSSLAALDPPSTMTTCLLRALSPKTGLRAKMQYFVQEQTSLPRVLVCVFTWSTSAMHRLTSFRGGHKLE